MAVADALALIAAGLAGVASAAGLVVAGLYRDAPYWVEQARGTDIATLFLAVPIVALGTWSAGRGSSFGRLTALGGLLYLIYNYSIFSFSVAINGLAIVYIATLGLAAWSFALTVRAIDAAGLWAATASRVSRRSTAAVLTAVALLFGMLWLGQIAEVVTRGIIPVDLTRAGLPTNPVYALDLGLFLPLCVVAAWGLLRGHPLAAAFAVPMLLWLSMTSAGIVGGFWFTSQAGEVVPVPVVVLVGGIGIVTGLLAALPLVRRTA